MDIDNQTRCAKCGKKIEFNDLIHMTINGLEHLFCPLNKIFEIK